MDAASSMDRQYRYQRYVYDLTRKYYLFGRDTVLGEIPLGASESLLEIGCGTARNLIKLAERDSGALLCGIDASANMLETAQRKLDKRRDRVPVRLRWGLAEQASHVDFGLSRPFDHILFSYVLSMIPDWRTALEHAVHMLDAGGQLHIVDFSDQAAMPGWFRQSLLTWLDWFHVHPQPDLPAHLEKLAAREGDVLRMRHLPGRYALIAHYERRAAGR